MFPTKEIVEAVRAEGIWVGRLESFNSGIPWTRLAETVRALEVERMGEIHRARLDPGEKATYRFFPTQESRGDWAPLALEQVASLFLPAATAYFGAPSKIASYDILKTFPATAPRSSMKWHRDFDAPKLLKIFVYMHFVSRESGAFEFARGTHFDPPDAGAGDRFEDEQIEQSVPRDRWQVIEGNAGTVIVADTRGIHRGGWCRSMTRLIFTVLLTPVKR